MLIKEHMKPSETGAPKSRAVCGASSSINGEMSEWVSMILDSANAALPTCGVISSEELLGYVDELGNKLDDDNITEDDIFVGSLDVEALSQFGC